jgi:hypothetical protein
MFFFFPIVGLEARNKGKKKASQIYRPALLPAQVIEGGFLPRQWSKKGPSDQS